MDVTTKTKLSILSTWSPVTPPSLPENKTICGKSYNLKFYKYTRQSYLLASNFIFSISPSIKIVFN